MSFQAFRKHEKPLLIAACVFTVIVFAFFPAFGDITDFLGGERAVSGSDLAGTFTVATTGDVREVSLQEFEQTRVNLARLDPQRRDWDENDIWAHIIETADARGAGIEVSRQELLDQLKRLTGGAIRSQEDYRSLVVNGLRFSSLKAFEAFMSDSLARDRWREVRLKAAEVVPAEDVFETRWKTDNERFDIEALVFVDADPESIADPGDDVLRAHFEAMPEWQRQSTFVEKARVDLVYGWLPFTAYDEIPADILAAVETPGDDAVAARFQRVGRLRFPELTEADAETSEMLRRELQIIAVVERAHQEVVAIQSAAEVAAQAEGSEDAGDADGEGDETADADGDTAEGEVVDGEATDGADVPSLDKATFVEVMTRHGLRVGDPEGLLDADAVKTVEGIGNDRLALYLARVAAGDVHYLPPFGGDEVVQVILVEEKQDERPLGFEEAREQVLAHWRDEQAGQAAEAFRDGLRAAARTLPEVEELVAPVLAQAAAAAEAEIAAAGSVLGVEAMEAIRLEKLNAAQADIDARVAQFEHLVWDEVAAGAEAERRTWSDVSRAYRTQPDPEEDPVGLDRFVKSHGAIFALGVNGISPVLRHAGSRSSVVARVTARRYPDIADMFADAEGMQAARRQVAMAKQMEFYTELTPEAVVQAHGLAVVEREEPEVAGDVPSSP